MYFPEKAFDFKGNLIEDIILNKIYIQEMHEKLNSVTI